MTVKTAALAVLVAALTGCATSTPRLSDLKPIEDDRRLSFGSPVENGASITFLRLQSFAGSAANYQLLIDGETGARLAFGEHVTLFVKSGERIIEVRGPELLGMGGIADSTTLMADPGGKYFYRIASDIGKIQLLRTTEQSVAAQ